MTEVRDNKAQNRFELDVEGATAFANYRLAPSTVIITHTETPRALRGRVQNLGKQRRLVSRLSRHVRHYNLESKPAPHHYSRLGFHTAWFAGTHNHRC